MEAERPHRLSGGSWLATSAMRVPLPVWRDERLESASCVVIAPHRRRAPSPSQSGRQRHATDARLAAIPAQAVVLARADGAIRLDHRLLFSRRRLDGDLGTGGGGMIMLRRRVLDLAAPAALLLALSFVPTL